MILLHSFLCLLCTFNFVYLLSILIILSLSYYFMGSLFEYNVLLAFSTLPVSTPTSNVTDSNPAITGPTQFQKEVIAGLMLSDGHLRNPNKGRRPGGNYRLEFTFKAAVLDFCKWIKFDLLGSLSSATNPTPYPPTAPTQYWFATRNSTYFSEIYGNWYTYKSTGATKVLPSVEYFNDFFSGISLAHCIMGDGYWETDSQTVYICTECFTKSEVYFLISFFKTRFNLEATTKARNGSFRIRFSSTSENLTKLTALVKPHMHPSMLYKLGPVYGKI